MPPLEDFDQVDTAVLWEWASVDGYGRQRVAEPVEVPVRWVQKWIEVPDGQGSSIILEATVALDRRVRVGSILWLGTLEEWEEDHFGTGTSIDDPELHVVRTSNNTNDVKGISDRWELGLQRWRQELPEIA